MNIVVIGSGGREHAIVWKLKQNKNVKKIYCLPGNGGIGMLAECVSIPVDDIEAIGRFALEKKADYVVVGPEAPLAAGAADHFRTLGLKVFGSVKKSAMLEGSKIFSKNFMKKHGIPTADFRTFSDYSVAEKYLSGLDKPLVVKADGLAAGKGVIMCGTPEDAKKAAKDMLVDKSFGNAGKEILIEDCLEGREISVIAFCDGKTLLPMPSAQDHKRAYDNDEGPNTGGMGAYSPVPFVNDAITKKVKERVLDNFIRGLRADNMDYCGIIYFGLLLVNGSDPYVLEFNVRFGDPETQPVLPLLRTDLVELIDATVNGKLDSITMDVSSDYSMCVVLASGGYPGRYAKGMEITGLDRVKDAAVFHAGTRSEGGKFLTSGGRVLGVTAQGKTFREARDRAYDAVSVIKFRNMHYRKDIGSKAMKDSK